MANEVQIAVRIPAEYVERADALAERMATAGVRAVAHESCRRAATRDSSGGSKPSSRITPRSAADHRRRDLPLRSSFLALPRRVLRRADRSRLRPCGRCPWRVPFR